jgi:hypothetical protein
MEKVKRLLPLLFLSTIIVAAYHAWFMSGILTGGDFNTTFPSMYLNAFVYPYAWYWNQGSALGGNAIPLLWTYFSYAVASLIFGKILGLYWGIFERVAYFYPFLLIGIVSSITLAKYIFSKKIYAIFTALLFLVNTYILMIAEGGQIWILLAYSLSPLALYLFIKSINAGVDNFQRINLKLAILTGLVFSLLIMFELRIAYIVLLAGFIYWFLRFLEKRELKVFLKAFIFAFLIPGILSLGIHAFWLFPTIILRQNPANQLGTAYTTANAVQFFSFAKLENTISLLHPNWPENIFGKTYFMRPEFLLLPILAFLALLFIRRNGEARERIYIIFFAILGIIGAFLAKGANEPFGGVYLWMFSHIPGFIMFRDPTKWYLLVAISYSILIPYSMYKIFEWLKLRNKFSISNFQFPIKNKFFNPQNLFLIIISISLILLVYPAFLGELKGTFKPSSIPSEYVGLENFLSSQKTFSRILWVPQVQRFGLNSIAHPGVSSESFYGKYEIQQVLDELKKGKAERVLEEFAIKYIIVPYDTEGEIYLKDRKYDQALYLKTLNEVSKISYLKKVDGFGKIGVFEIAGVKEHFWSPSNSLNVNYENINPVEYKVAVKNAKKGDVIVFAESYDQKWIAKNSEFKIQSLEFGGIFNSFVLPKEGDYSLEIYYTPQDYVNIGVGVSVISLVFIFGSLAFLIIKKK